MSKRAVTWRLDEGLLDRVRRAAGPVPVSRWVQRALEQALSSDPSLDESRSAGPAASTRGPARESPSLPDLPWRGIPAPSKAPGGYVRLLNPRPKGLR